MKKFLGYIILQLVVYSTCFPNVGHANSVVVPWGFSSEGLTNVPAAATNVVGVAAGALFNIVLNRDGTLTSWGNGAFGATNIPSTLTNVAAISASEGVCGGYTLALDNKGTVLSWGNYGPTSTQIPSELTNARAIAAAGNHALALKSDGTVLAWGDNRCGQTNVPSSLTNVVAITAGSGYSLALKSDGTVIAWGANTNVPVGLRNVVAIAAGGGQSLALKSDGSVVAWGDNDSGQSTVPPGLSDVVAISCGADHNIALKRDGRVVAWGSSVFGQTNVPSALSNVVAISACSYQNLALVGDGLPYFSRFPINQTQPAGGSALFCMPATGKFPIFYQWQFNGTNIQGATNWFLELSNVQDKNIGDYRVVASNDYGVVTSQVASLTVIPSVPVICTQPEDLRTWPGATAGLSTATFGSEPRSFQWRYNGEPLPGATNAFLQWNNVHFGLRGAYDLVFTNFYGAVTSRLAQVSVSPVVYWGRDGAAVPPEMTDVAAIAGVYHGLALHPNGTVTAWGDNSSGQTNVPPDLTNAVAIAGGGAFSMALRADGTVTAWGDNSWGQINVPAELSNVIAIAAGGGHALALRGDGTVAAWGMNDWSQANVPAGLNNVVAIAAGNAHSLALRANGTVAAWGDGRQRQIYPPRNLSNVVAIAAGYSCSLAVLENGSMVDWGYLNGSTSFSLQGSNYVAVSGANGHCLALRKDGTVIGWGGNYYGETNVPPGLANVVSIVAASSYSFALVGNGAPRLTTAPACQIAYLGKSGFFSVSPSGIGPMSFQWQCNGTNLAGATNWFLRLSDITAANAGQYRAIISNQLGVATSPSTTLTVKLPEFDVSPGTLQMSALGLQLSLKGFSGQLPIVIHASTNFVDWEPIYTNAGTSGPIYFTDPSGTNQCRRFYRAQELR